MHVSKSFIRACTYRVFTSSLRLCSNRKAEDVKLSHLSCELSVTKFVFLRPHEHSAEETQMRLEELVLTGVYVAGAVCIVLLTLSISWLVVWKCVLSKMPFVQELFDLTPENPSAVDVVKSISFQDRYQAYKRVSEWVHRVLYAKTSRSAVPVAKDSHVRRHFGVAAGCQCVCVCVWIAEAACSANSLDRQRHSERVKDERWLSAAQKIAYGGYIPTVSCFVYLRLCCNSVVRRCFSCLPYKPLAASVFLPVIVLRRQTHQVQVRS